MSHVFTVFIHIGSRENVFKSPANSYSVHVFHYSQSNIVQETVLMSDSSKRLLHQGKTVLIVKPSDHFNECYLPFLIQLRFYHMGLCGTYINNYVITQSCIKKRYSYLIIICLRFHCRSAQIMEQCREPYLLHQLHRNYNPIVICQ